MPISASSAKTSRQTKAEYVKAPRIQSARKQCHGHAQTAIRAQLHHHPGEQHGSGGGRSDVAGRRPGVKWPQAGENPKANKHQRKRPHLKMDWKWKLSELHQIHRLRSGHHVGRDQSDQHHRAADKRIERELHRGILTTCGAPDRNQKILGDDRDLVEDEQQQQIEAQKYAVHAADQRQIESEKFLGPILDVPGKQNAEIATIPVSRSSVRLIPSAAR